MRFLVSTAVFLALSTSPLPVLASSIDDKLALDQQTIDALELKASQAQPREQCFLYAEVVHQMTELSLRQYAAGDVGKAAGLLKQVQALTHKIHMSVANDNKKLKDTEILLRHTAFRLTEMLHASSFDDTELVQQTLTQVNKAQTEAMLQVFKK
jgi:hypothetical protein